MAGAGVFGGGYAGRDDAATPRGTICPGTALPREYMHCTYAMS
jgi:hypothetical protein